MFDSIGKDIRNFIIKTVLVLIGLGAVVWYLVSAY